MAIIRLYEVVLTHSQGFFENQVSGINIIVGIKIFSIVGDLNFEHSHSHRYVRWSQARPNQPLLHKQRILVGLKVPLIWILYGSGKLIILLE